MTFRIGQKVARVSGRNSTEYVAPPLNEPVTVANIYIDPDGELMLEIAEFPVPETATNRAGFRSKFFRPIVERKTSIAIFTEMLTPSPARSRELCGND